MYYYHFTGYLTYLIDQNQIKSIETEDQSIIYSIIYYTRIS